MTASVIAAIFGLRAVFAAVALYYLAILVIGAYFLPAAKRKRFRLQASFAGGG